MILYGHQRIALNKTTGLHRVAYYLDMGLGKTFVASEKVKQLNENNNILICQKSLIEMWKNHFKTYYEFEIYDLSTQLNEFLNSVNKKVGIISYQMAWRRKQLSSLNDFTLILDESSMIQNAKAKQTRFILNDLKPTNVILLSGSPTSGKYENLWSQLSLLGSDMSERTFNNRYINFTKLQTSSMPFPIKIVDKKNPYKNVDDLKLQFRNHGAIFMKTEDVYNLPSQTFIPVMVDKPKEYTKFMKDKFIKIKGKELVGDVVLTQHLYARQLASQYNSNKVNAVIDLLNSSEDRFIIFYNFDEELKILKDICEKLSKPISEVNGHNKSIEAYEKKTNSVTLCQARAGAYGHNFQKANKIIYFSLMESVDLWMQSIKRIHRLNQDRPCFYYLLLAKGTIDVSIYKALQSGEDYTNNLFREEFA